MHRQSKSPLKVKDNESGCLEEKDESSFPLPQDQKICKGTKFRVIRASKKENLSGGNWAWSPKRGLKSPRGLGEELSHPEGDPGSCPFPGGSWGAPQGGVGSEPTLPLNRKGNFPGSRSGSLGSDSYSTPERDKAGGKPDLGISEERREKPIDFATVTITEFGIAPESFTQRCKGNSPTTLKFRRRSTIGLRGSPENNTLIRYLAQQRSKRQKEAFTQISPFKHANVRSLKDKIETFQTSFESLQEAEGETGLSHVEDSQEGGSSENKVPFKKEPNLEQWSEKFMLDNSGADLKENCRENVTRSSKSDARICSILSPNPAVTEPAAPQEWLYGQKNPPESLETVAVGNTLERGHVSRSADTRSDVLSDLSRKKVGFVEGPSLGMFEESKAFVTPPATPRRAGNVPFSDLTHSGSLRSILKKTPTRQLLDSPKDYLNGAVGRRGESVPVSYYEKMFKASEAENTENLDFRTPKKKKVTFGEDLSPEIFDQSLPANTPLHRGASPGLSSSSSPRPGWSTDPLPRLDFDCDDECVEAPQDFLEPSSAAEDSSPVENGEAAPTDKPDMVKTRSPAKRKRRAEPEEPHCSPSAATSPRNAEDIKIPRKNKIQRQKNPTTSAPKKTQRTRQTSYGKRRKRKVKKPLYGERQMASKKPLLSPIAEIPEVCSSVSSPDSPKADGLFSEEALADNPNSWSACKDVQEKEMVEGMRGKNLVPAADVCPSSEDLDMAAPNSSRDGTFQVSQGAPGTEQEVSNVVPDAEGGFDTSEHFQQGEEAACENEAKESSSLIENEQPQGNLLEFVEQQATDVHKGAHRTQCPQTDPVSASPARRRRSSSAIYFPPVESLELTGIDLLVSSYNVEEVLSVPRGSFRRSRGRSSTSGETRVRRSMRLSKAAGSEGLAWVQLPSELPKQPPLAAAAPKPRRRVCTSILVGSEKVQPREQNLGLFSALGKENEDSARRADGPCRRRRRRRKTAPMPPETPWAQTQHQTHTQTTNSVKKKDRNNTKHSEEAEIPLEVTLGEVPAISDFLK